MTTKLYPSDNEDGLDDLRAAVAAAEEKRIEIAPEDRVKAELLAKLAREAERLKEEERTRLEFVMNDARFKARRQLGPDAIIDATVIDGVGAFVVRAPSTEERRILNDKAGTSGFDTATVNLLMKVTLFPGQEEMKAAITRSPYLVDTLITMAMQCGGLQMSADRRKSG